MGRMIRSKKEFRCKNCSAVHIKWAGTCKQCGQTGTLEEYQLIPVKPRANLSQKSLLRRSKTSERNIAKRMQDVDGKDPNFAGIATSTGRIGHITNIRVDGVSKNYFTENKNRVLPKWTIDAWILINQRGQEFHKHPLLHIEPPNMPKDFLLNGERHKLDTMAIIRQDRHEELIEKEKLGEMAREILQSDVSDPQMLYELRALFGLLK